MKYFAIIGILFFGLACGGGGSKPTPPVPTPHPPGISNFNFTSPSSVPQGSGGGAATVTWTFDFIDSGKDVTTMIVEFLDASGNVGNTVSTQLTGTSGLTSGTIAAAGTFPTTIPVGSWNWRFRVVDSVGNVSNNLNATWTITSPPTGIQTKVDEKGWESVSISSAEIK